MDLGGGGGGGGGGGEGRDGQGGGVGGVADERTGGRLDLASNGQAPGFHGNAGAEGGEQRAEHSHASVPLAHTNTETMCLEQQQSASFLCVRVKVYQVYQVCVISRRLVYLILQVGALCWTSTRTKPEPNRPVHVC